MVLPTNLKEQLFTRHIGGGRKSQERPLLYAMVGIPASGKTTFLSEQSKIGVLPDDHYYHNPDVIMIEIPQYKQDVMSIGPEAAKQKWELPCREFADTELFPEALRRKLNIVMDMGLCRPEIIEMVKNCKAEEYEICLNIIGCRLDQAITRAKRRINHVPEETVRKRARFLADNIERIIAIADSAKAYDNTNLEKPYKPIPPYKVVQIFNRYYEDEQAL